MKLGEFIRNHRERLGLSVREFGKLVEVSGAYISMIEINKITTIPSEEVIKKISFSLKLTQEESDIFYNLYEDCMQEKVNKKILSLKSNVVDMKDKDDGMIIDGNSGKELKHNKIMNENGEILDLKGFSEEERKAIKDFIEYMKFKNR